MKIQIIGPGCPRCTMLAQFTEQAVKDLGITADISKVTQLDEIMAFGVMSTPALAVNGKVKLSGKVPGIPELRNLLQQPQ